MKLGQKLSTFAHNSCTFELFNMDSEQNKKQPNNPLHGVKLVEIIEHLVDYYGWEEMGARIEIKCFNDNPSVKSSLKFLRKTPWAREKVEQLYVLTFSGANPWVKT